MRMSRGEKQALISVGEWAARAQVAESKLQHIAELLDAYSGFPDNGFRTAVNDAVKDYK